MGAGPRKRDLAELIQFGRAVGDQLRGPVADTIRGKVANWRDPRARMLRRRRRAKRATFAWGSGTVLGGVGVGVEAVNHVLLGFPGVSLMGMTVVLGYCAVSSGMKTLRLHREPLPAAPAPPVALPPTGSAAREPMRRLAEAEASLDELMRQLGTARQGGIAPVPAESLAHAQEAAAETAMALRAVAAQLTAVEKARDITPMAQRGPLNDGVRGLRRRLDEGLDSYLSLITTAGQAVIASSTVTPNEALLDASDRLTGLASALRELSQPSQN
jgi:hypothetical protein